MFDLIPFGQRERGLFGELGSLLNDPFFRDFGARAPAMKIDLEDKGDHLELQTDLPGMKKEDVNISVNGDVLQIQVNHTTTESDEGKNYIYRERRQGMMCRRLDVTGIDADKIEASFADGVLRMKLPKKTELTPAERRIEIQG